MSIQHNAIANNFGEEYAQELPELADALAQVLTLFGCHNIYGVGGDFAANLIAGLQKSITLSPSSNEMHAGFSACGQAEIDGIGAVLTTYTVGSLPCTTAAALAITEKLPVIFISGAPGESEIADHTIHHTIASASTWYAQYDCALNAFRALGMKAERLQGARSVQQPNMAAERFFQLVSEAYINKQPVFIEVPRDLVFQPTQALSLPDNINEIQRDTFVLKGSEIIAQQIINKISRAKKPLVFVGENVKLNTTLRQQILSFCHKLNIPYATTWLAKGIFNESDPLCHGTYNGVFSHTDNRDYIENEVDYILEIDTSIHHQDTNSAFDTGTHHVNNFENKTVIKGTVENQQGVINIFKCLLAARLTPFELFEPRKEKPHVDPSGKIDFHNIAQVLNELQQKTEQAFVYLPEVGNSYFASYSLVTKKSDLGRSWLTNPWYAAMGTSLPYARAASKTLKRLNSDDRAIVITGDGGFNFQLNELIHFQREQLPLIIIYMRNDIFHLGKSGEGEIYHCSTPEFDAIKLVHAYGGMGYHCKTVSDFTLAMNTALACHNGISLIEVPADISPNFQSHEIKMLNLYIQSKNGNPEAIERWKKLTRN